MNGVEVKRGAWLVDSCTLNDSARRPLTAVIVVALEADVVAVELVDIEAVIVLDGEAETVVDDE